MEPLTIIGLVSNVVQLVDAATKAATACHEIYKRGATIEDLELARTTDQLHQSYSSLSKSLQSKSTDPILQSGFDLRAFSEQCCQSAQSLTDELKVLQTTPGSKREALLKFVNRRRKASKIESHRRQLNKYQKTLDTKVLIDIRRITIELFTQQKSHDAAFESEVDRIAADLASCNTSAAMALKSEIAEALEANKKEHEATRNKINSHIDTTIQRQDLRKQQELFLESLQFQDINSRLNDVSEPNTKTFGWIFDDKIKHSWDSFNDWLQQGQKIYWINGKAGSGKSTLMKFIVEEERTNQALKIWSAEKPCIVLSFYFWLSGSKLQRSMKGLLCSLLHQICLKNKNVLERVYISGEAMTRKRTTSDWSLKELRDLLNSVIELTAHEGNICIFLDGVDEFDQDENVLDLLGIIEGLLKFRGVKFCVSSRPEVYLEKRLSQYSKLRLQDLTANDLKLCVEDALDHARKEFRPVNISEKEIDRFTSLMTEKADGVFLWIYFAMQSLRKGMENEDNFQILLDRLGELPKGMERLYEEMWRRLNGDERRYREEASLYFSYHEFFPLPLFEMMVITDDDVRDEYLSNLKIQDFTIIAGKCEALKTRILTRCAGLIEVANNETNAESDYEDGSEGADEADDDKDHEDHEDHEDVSAGDDEDNNGKDKVDHSLGDRYAQLPAKLTQDLDNTKVGFLHRTARDFILNTKTGQDIAKEPSLSRDQRFVNVTKGRMASLLQGFERFNSFAIRRIAESVGASETECEIELLKELRCICQAFSVPGSPRTDITRRYFWSKYSVPQDFTTMAASCGCLKYVQHFVPHECDYVSPYYLGSLFQCATLGLTIRPTSQKIQSASWLLDQGADIITKQWGRSIEAPRQSLLKNSKAAFFNSSMTADQASQIAQLIIKSFHSGQNSTETYVERLPPSILGRAESFNTKHDSTLQGLWAEMEVGYLYRLALDLLARWGAKVENIRYGYCKAME